MILFSIPDIRLFWSTDPRFISQFTEDGITIFKPYSKYPPCFKDVSFWTKEHDTLHENDFCDLVRDVAGDLVEDVRKVSITVRIVNSLLIIDRSDRFFSASSNETHELVLQNQL